ncbi:MAG: pilus assembly protein CpaB [Actinomycetota bacterium]|nr:pilus assembly protein CpaB [Actinomycetota bacterium]
MTGGGPRAGPALPGWLREVRRAAAWHRRLLTAGLLAAAVAFALQAVTPSPPPGARVVVAARDLSGGVRVSGTDVTVHRVPRDALPGGALRERADAEGRILVGPVRKGEVLTDVRLVGRSLLEAYGDTLVAAPVRIADAASVRLLHAGDVVDVLAAGADDGGAGARLVASAVPVVSVPAASGSVLGPTDTSGALVVVVTTDTTAARLAAAAVSQRLSVVLRSG